MAAKAKAFKCDLVKRSTEPGLTFAPTLGRGGYWANQIQQLREDPDLMLKVRADDQSSMTQIRQSAKKLQLQVVVAKKGDFVFFRVYMPGLNQARLVMLLREPRTLNELRSKNLELDLVTELADLQRNCYVSMRKDKYQLTDAGSTALVPSCNELVAASNAAAIR